MTSDSVPVIAETRAVSARHNLTDYGRIARRGYIAIALAFGGFGTWAATAPLDSAAVANGTVAVTSDRKPIAHLEGGIIKEIMVAENARVKAGQILFKLQPVQAQSNADVLKKQLDGSLAQEARSLAERDLAPRIQFPQSLLERRNEPDMARVLFDQEKQFAERKRSIDSQVEVLRRRIAQTQNDIIGKQEQEASLKLQQANMRAEISSVTSLAEKGFFPRNKLSEKQRALFSLDGELGRTRSDILRSREMIEESESQIRVTQQRQVEEASQQLADVRAKLTEIREKLQVALDVLTRVEIRAPQDGAVQGLKVHAVGQVVRPGEPVAEMVTVDDGLIMTAQVKPTDVDAVVPGLKAEIRFPAFASKQKHATLGRVESISSDAMFDQNTKQTFYNARVVIDMETLPADLRAKLTPGMPATVLIVTGERTMLSYLLSPLFDAVARTMRER